MMGLDLVFNNWHPATSFRSTSPVDCELRMQQVTAHHHTSPLLSRKTITTDGARSYGLNELNRHFRAMIHRLREWYLETAEVVVINWTMKDLGMT